MPKDIAEELGLVEGSTIAFKKKRDVVIIEKVERTEDPLREAMLWNPKRSGRPKTTEEKEIKQIWRDS